MGNKKKSNVVVNSGTGTYFLAMIGAAVYYLSIARGFWGGVLALLKALVWPAFLTYDVLRFIAR